MTQEIVRELVNGVWVTRAVDQGGGGGGLPTGWTQVGNPADVDSNGGNLDVNALSSFNEETNFVTLLSAGGNVKVHAGSVDPTINPGIPDIAGSFYLRTNGEAWLKTGVGDTDWSQLGTSSGTPGVLTSAARRFTEIATADTESFAITSADPIVTNAFTVAGDHETDFPYGLPFAIVGSTGNDGVYTVASATFAAGQTTIVVNEGFSDATPDGTIQYGLYTATFDIDAGTIVAAVYGIVLAVSDPGNAGWAADLAYLRVGDTLTGSSAYFDYGQIDLHGAYTNIYDPAASDSSQFFDMRDGNTYQTSGILSWGTVPSTAAGIRYENADTITVQVAAAISTPPVVPGGVLLFNLLYLAPVVPIDATT